MSCTEPLPQEAHGLLRRRQTHKYLHVQLARTCQSKKRPGNELNLPRQAAWTVRPGSLPSSFQIVCVLDKTFNS